MGGWGQGEGAHTQGSATHSRVLGQALPEMPGPQAPAGPVLDAAPRVVERRVEMPAAAAFAGGAPAAWAEAGGRAFRPSLALSDRSASSLNKLWASQGNGVCCNGGGGGQLAEAALGSFHDFSFQRPPATRRKGLVTTKALQLSLCPAGTSFTAGCPIDRPSPCHGHTCVRSRDVPERAQQGLLCGEHCRSYCRVVARDGAGWQ